MGAIKASHNNVRKTPVMSQDQLQAFGEAVATNADLQEQLNAAADADAVVEIAKQAGFLISAEDLEQAKAQTELSDAELEQVTGGIGGLGIAAAAFGWIPGFMGRKGLTASNPNAGAFDQLSSDPSAFKDISVG